MAKSPLDRLTSLGEDVLGKASHKASQNPTAARFLQVENQLENLIDLQIAARLPVINGSEK